MRLALLLLAVWGPACGAPSPVSPGAGASTQPASTALPGRSSDEQLRRGSPPPAALAVRPRYQQPGDQRPGLQVLPDGELREWEAAQVSWLELRPSAGSAPAAGRSARLALQSYGSGLSLAVDVRDPDRRPARAAATLQSSDHVEIELWPAARPRTTERPRDAALGIHFRVGSLRELTQLVRPAEPWRETSIRSFGAETEAGYLVEVRVPLAALAPLPFASVDRVDYRVTVHDRGDGEGAAARPVLRLEGTARLDPPLAVPDGVQRRASVRACMASEPEALWGYENGWRCSIPYLDRTAGLDDDARPGHQIRLGHSLLPEPPTLIWIRERVIFVNLAGVNRGLAALLDKKETLHSLLPLGVVGSLDPGSTWARDSDAEPLKLPDGSWAVAVTHAYPASSTIPGGRCAAGHRVFLSIIALRGCLISTPHQPAPEPPFPPFLEEVFRVCLEDCEATSASDWQLSKDATTIKVHSSLYPRRPPRVYRYRDGRYRREEG